MKLAVTFLISSLLILLCSSQLEAQNIASLDVKQMITNNYIDSDFDGIPNILEDLAGTDVRSDLAFYVDPEHQKFDGEGKNKPFTSLSDAISAASELSKKEDAPKGYKVIFVRGEMIYDEKIILKDVEMIKIIGGISKMFVTVSEKSKVNGSITIEDSRDVQISGFEIKNSIISESIKRPDECKFIPKDLFGISIIDSDDVTISDNKIISNENGIRVLNSSRIRLDKNQIRSDGLCFRIGGAINISNCNGIEITNNSVIAKSDPNFPPAETVGVGIYNSKDALIINNHIYSELTNMASLFGGKGLEIFGGDARVTKNVIHTKGQNPKIDIGISLDYDSEIREFIANTIFNTGSPVFIDYSKLVPEITSEITDITDVKSVKKKISKPGLLFSGEVKKNKTANLDLALCSKGDYNITEETELCIEQ